MGVEGQQAGITLGKARKLSTKLKGLIIELQKAGDPLPELRDLQEAIKILETSGPEGYSVGGMVEDDRINIFEDNLPEGSFEVASLKLPFFKMFGKAPVNEIAPIPTSINLNLLLSNFNTLYLVVTPNPIGAWFASPLEGAYWTKSPVTKPWFTKLIELSTVVIPTGLTISFLFV